MAIHSNAQSNYYFRICHAAFYSGGFIVTEQKDKSENISAPLAGVMDLEVDTGTFCTMTEASRRLLWKGRHALEDVKSLTDYLDCNGVIVLWHVLEICIQVLPDLICSRLYWNMLDQRKYFTII